MVEKLPEYKVGQMLNYRLDPIGKAHLMRRIGNGDDTLITLCSAGSCGTRKVEEREGLTWVDVNEKDRCKVCERARFAAERRVEAVAAEKLLAKARSQKRIDEAIALAMRWKEGKKMEPVVKEIKSNGGLAHTLATSVAKNEDAFGVEVITYAYEYIQYEGDDYISRTLERRGGRYQRENQMADWAWEEMLDEAFKMAKQTVAPGEQMMKHATCAWARPPELLLWEVRVFNDGHDCVGDQIAFFFGDQL